MTTSRVGGDDTPDATRSPRSSTERAGRGRWPFGRRLPRRFGEATSTGTQWGSSGCDFFPHPPHLSVLHPTIYSRERETEQPQLLLLSVLSSAPTKHGKEEDKCGQEEAGAQEEQTVVGIRCIGAERGHHISKQWGHRYTI